MKQFLSSLSGNGIWGALTGGSMNQMSLFALSISPYITASIVLQLVAVFYKPLQDLQKDGKTGQDKYKMITSVTGVSLALIQSLAMAIGFGQSGLLSPYNTMTVFGAVVIWTAGAFLLILLGNFLDNFELGSGISMLLLLNIVSTLPSDVASLFTMLIKNNSIAISVTRTILIVAVYTLIIFYCVFLSTSEKRLFVTYSNRLGRNSLKTKAEFPIPLMTTGVMPVIFAGTIITIPVIVSQFVPALRSGIPQQIVKFLSPSAWFDVHNIWYTAGAVLYILIAFFFGNFYREISFNEKEIATNLKKSGGVFPGIRAGKQTEDYLRENIIAVNRVGCTYLLILILAGHVLTNNLNMSGLSFTGTSVIIAVSCLNDIANRCSTVLEFSAKYNYKSQRLLV